jgi:hypothetical protein
MAAAAGGGGSVGAADDDDNDVDVDNNDEDGVAALEVEAELRDVLAALTSCEDALPSPVRLFFLLAKRTLRPTKFNAGDIGSTRRFNPISNIATFACPKPVCMERMQNATGCTAVPLLQLRLAPMIEP